MTNRHFKLAITESAYHAVLDTVSQIDIFDPLPVLNYNSESKAYKISADSAKHVREIECKNKKDNQQLVYQVGRLRMFIESQKLVEQVNGKKLDYLNGNFVIS